jgi:acid phosphatase type 7
VRDRLPIALLLAGAALVVGLGVLIAARDDDPGASSSQAPGRFASPPQSRSATLWAVGDGADGSQDSRRLARLIAQDEPQAFVYLGDVYPEGTAADFRANYDTVYGRLRSVTLPTPGNHDWPNHDDGYDPYWARVTGGDDPPHHYSTSIAGWRILSLNSEESIDPGSAQVRWLARQVADGGSCRIAFWHRPRYSAGTHGDQPDVESLWRLVAGRAALVLNGHDHDLQELERHQGTVELVVGAGGLDQYPVDASDPRLAWSSDRVDGALRVRLSPDRARYDFVSPTGAVLRSGTARCRRS